MEFLKFGLRNFYVYENECVVLVIKTFSLLKVSNFRLVNDLSKTEIFS